jgi:hypothetical protein
MPASRARRTQATPADMPRRQQNKSLRHIVDTPLLLRFDGATAPVNQHVRVGAPHPAPGMRRAVRTPARLRIVQQPRERRASVA